MYRLLTFVALLWLSFNIFGQIQTVNYKKNKTVNAEQWQVADVLIKLKAKVESPFTAEASALITKPDGTEQNLPIFYNGGTQWILRFSGNETGTYSFTTNSEIKGLHGLTGKFEVVENTNENKHGGVVLNPENKKHFYFQDGTPYFLMAFECDWLYALDYHNETEIPKTEHFLNLMNQNGFNQIVMNVFAYDVGWEKDQKLKDHPEHEFGAPKDIFPFLGNNENPDFSSLNIDFFKKFDRTITALEQHDIISHLMIYVWNKKVAWPDMNTEADNMYFDYVIKRYQAFPHIMWDVSKEALFYGRCDMEYLIERIERIKKLDSYKRLISVHDKKFCTKHPEKVDYISIQDWEHNIYNTMLAETDKYKDKPIFNIEHGGYEQSYYHVFPGAYTDAETCLRRNYLCLFAGTYSTYYWQATSWNALIYNPFEQSDEFYKPKFEYFKHLTGLFEKFPYANLKPSPWRNANGYNLSGDDGTVLIYTPKENYAIKPTWFVKPVEGKKVTVQWFNTITGEYTDEVEVTKDKKPSFRSPWSGEHDAVFIKKETGI